MSDVSPLPRYLPPVSRRLPPTESRFAQEVGYEKRLAEAEAKLQEFSDRVPVILEAGPRSTLTVDKRKFLVPGDASVAQFFQTIRKRFKLTPEQGLFLFVDNMLPPMTHSMSQLYKDHACNDRFLYMQISSETTFGAVTGV